MRTADSDDAGAVLQFLLYLGTVWVVGCDLAFGDDSEFGLLMELAAHHCPSPR